MYYRAAFIIAGEESIDDMDFLAWDHYENENDGDKIFKESPMTTEEKIMFGDLYFKHYDKKFGFNPRFRDDKLHRVTAFARWMASVDEETFEGVIRFMG